MATPRKNTAEKAEAQEAAPLSPQQKMVQALRKLQVDEARATVREIQDRTDPATQMAEMTGLKKKRPYRAMAYSTLPDHSIALDSDGKPAGNPDNVKVWVPRTDSWGRKEDSRIHSFRDFGYQVVKDRVTDEEVEGRFGVLMEADPEAAAHRTHVFNRTAGGIDPFTYFTATAMEAIEGARGADHVHVRPNKEHHSGRYLTDIDSED